jgi:hypothetical protein
MIAKAKTRADMFDALKKAKSVSSVIADSLQELRDQVEDAKSRREEILGLPVPVEVAISRAVDAMRRDIADAQQRSTRPSQFAVSPASWSKSYHSMAEPGTLALAWLGDLLIDAVPAQIKAVYGENAGVTDHERQKLLDENDRELLDTELAEESIIRYAEDQGFSIERRIDADPRAILAHQSEMP